MDVSVSQEALQIVKTALGTFQTEVSGISARSSGKAESIRAECRASIRQTEDILAGVEQKIDALSQQIYQLERAIAYNTSEWKQLYDLIPQLYHDIEQIDHQVAKLKNEISYLYSQLSMAEDEAVRDQILAQIGALEREVNALWARQNDLRCQAQEAEERKARLQSQINNDKAEKARLESELSVQRNRCNRLRNKLERQKSAFARVESDLNAYLAAARKFEVSSTSAAMHNASAVGACIASIDGYLSVSL